MLEKATFLQGLFPFSGRGLEQPAPFPQALRYKVPFDKRAQVIYFRAGNSTDELIYLVMTRRGQPMRYFPVGAKGAVHVALAVVEDLAPDTEVELLIGAPNGLTGHVLIDVGFMEIG